MIDIKSLKIPELPFKLDKFVGTLLFHEFPSTTIFSSRDKKPIIKEWIDCNDDNTIDRFFIYETSCENLKLFLNGNLSHIDLFQSCSNKIGFIVDFQSSNILDIKVISPFSLPKDYLPNHDSYFEIDDGVDTGVVTEYFQLDNVEIDDKSNSIVSYANYKKSEIFNIHIKNGKKVSFGKIDTRLLGETLIKFDKFYKDVSLDFYLGKNRGEIKTEKKELNVFLELASTEVFAADAASYSIFIKPVDTGSDLFEQTSSSEKIANAIYEFISNSENDENLKISYANYSDYVFKSYKEFLEYIIKSEMKIDLNWYNPFNEKAESKRISYIKANETINSIENLQLESSDFFERKGKFRAININTGHFIFSSISEEKYNGKFDRSIQDSIEGLNFTDLYEIRINRKTIKETGRTTPKVEDKILSYFKLEE
jgi:rubrerythrin